MTIYFVLKRLTIALALIAPTSGWAQTAGGPPALDAEYSDWITLGPDPTGFGLTRTGNDADNVLSGSIHADAFDGGAGSDRMGGYGGRDIYAFEPGDGADYVFDHSPEGSEIRFQKIAQDTIEISEVPGFNGETDRIMAYGNGDAIRIVGWSRLSEAEQQAWSITYFQVPDAPQATAQQSQAADATPMNSMFVLYAIILAAVLALPILFRLFRR